jgi:AcrR family transcriptional regulator
MYQVVHVTNVPLGTPRRKPRQARQLDLQLVDRCLATFVDSGTLDVSLDQLASSVGTSKRMLIHYFGSRDTIEEQVVTRLEEQLRGQVSPDAFPPDVRPEVVVMALWDRATAPAARGVMLLALDLWRRAWQGSERAQAFYARQQTLWLRLLRRYFPDRATAEDVLQCFQGAALAYFVTGDRKPGRRVLLRIATECQRSAAAPTRRTRRHPADERLEGGRG